MAEHTFFGQPPVNSLITILVHARLQYGKSSSKTLFGHPKWNGTSRNHLSIAMDLSATFDMVHHNILLSALNSYYNIFNIALKWITSYLSDRQTYLNVYNLDSDRHIMDFSVPQGSILGPVLFNVYASTLESHLRLNNSNTPVIGYADDHSTYKQFLVNNRQAELDSIGMLEDTLQHVQQWMNLKCLKLNTNKTTHLFWSLQAVKKCTVQEINVCEDIVNRKESMCYLGLTVDENLSFKNHISNINKKSSYNLFMMGKICRYLTINTT